MTNVEFEFRVEGRAWFAHGVWRWCGKGVRWHIPVGRDRRDVSWREVYKMYRVVGWGSVISTASIGIHLSLDIIISGNGARKEHIKSIVGVHEYRLHHVFYLILHFEQQRLVTALLIFHNISSILVFGQRFDSIWKIHVQESSRQGAEPELYVKPLRALCSSS